MKAKRVLLIALIVSVVASAVLGIVAILSGSWSELETKILLTSMTISATALSLLVAVMLMESPGKKVLGWIGFAVALVAGLVIEVVLWAEIGDETFLKLMITLIIGTVATTHFSLLSLSRLAARFRFALIVSAVLIYGLAAYLDFFIWAGNFQSISGQIIAILSILVTCFSILVLVFHRLSLAAVPKADESPLHFVCPFCLHGQTSPPGEITCESCGSKFNLRVIQRLVPPTPPAV